MDYKKLYDALVTIQDVCIEMQDGEGCKGCPFSTGKDITVCCISDLSPFNWNIVKPDIKLMR